MDEIVVETMARQSGLTGTGNKERAIQIGHIDDHAVRGRHRDCAKGQGVVQVLGVNRLGAPRHREGSAIEETAEEPQVAQGMSPEDLMKPAPVPAPGIIADLFLDCPDRTFERQTQ